MKDKDIILILFYIFNIFDEKRKNHHQNIILYILYFRRKRIKERQKHHQINISYYRRFLTYLTFFRH